MNTFEEIFSVPQETHQEEDRAGGFKPLPERIEGAVLSVSNAEFKKAGTGSKMVKLEFTIESDGSYNGEYTGRKAWAQCTILKSDGTVNNAGNGILKEFAHAMGFEKVGSNFLNECLGKKFSCNMVTKKNGSYYETKFFQKKNITNAFATQPQQPQQPQQQFQQPQAHNPFAQQ